LKYEDGRNPLYLAIEHGACENAEMLVDRTEDVGVSVNDWSTLLLSAHYGNGALVRQLAEKGANVNQSGPEGQTALMIAARCGRVEVIKTLLRKGAEVNQKDHLGRSALYHAVAAKRYDTVKLLLDAGAEE
ncbi:MAG: ankyrin repeat domain-containing protein, partial [Candidatus Omnitrophica bacterium]|nr:ankyrin repeat domain-containing protein [Candidatus Omnitrophota bacterium]